MKISRRDFVKTAGAAAVAATPVSRASAAGNAPVSQPQDQGRPAGSGRGKRPNFLIILCDQMRFPTDYESEVLTKFRQQYLKTQTMLLESGVEFTQHHAASAACVPSRACMVTGQYPSLHGVSQTYGGAKEACDPDVFWLDPNSVPTFGNYFRTAGYRTFWKGKWHVSNADMLVPGTHDPLLSYDSETGERDPRREALYAEADRLGPYGFAGWIGPEAHGSDPLKDTGSSARTKNRGRDQGFAEQTIELIRQLDQDHRNATPWLLVCSFVNPHDIAVFSATTVASGEFDFHVDPYVPGDDDLFLRRYDASHGEDLSKKPKAQKSYRDTYGVWGGPIPPELGPHYRRFYYQVHKNVDEQMANVMGALLASRFRDDTIVVFTSDHGEMLGSHGDLHQKMFQAYEETTHVPFTVWSTKLFSGRRKVDSLTSHVDLAPTLLGLAGIDPEPIRRLLMRDHSDARALVGQDLSALILNPSGAQRVTEPIYFMTEDDPNRGLHMGDPQGITRPPVVDPKRVETVIARLTDGTLWKYSRYYDSTQYWTDPGTSGTTPEDVLLVQMEATPAPSYEGPIDYGVMVKSTPAADEYELYDITHDAMELANRYDDSACATQQAAMVKILAEQRAKKRLSPQGGDAPSGW